MRSFNRRIVLPTVVLPHPDSPTSARHGRAAFNLEGDAIHGFDIANNMLNQAGFNREVLLKILDLQKIFTFLERPRLFFFEPD